MSHLRRRYRATQWCVIRASDVRAAPSSIERVRDGMRDIARAVGVPWQVRSHIGAVRGWGTINSEGFTLVQAIRGIAIAR